MSYENLSNNRVTLVGTVSCEPTFSHYIFGEGFYEFTLKVNRLSQQYDVIPITISERLITEGSVSVGDKLGVVGQFRSYNKYDGEKSKLMLSVFVREMIDADEYDENPNVITLCGFICKPPIYRTTPFNREICDLLIAVNRAYNKSDYIPSIAWGRNARFVNGLHVGAKVYVTGRIQSREYVKTYEDGVTNTKTAYEVSIGKISLEDYFPEMQPTATEFFANEGEN